MISRYTRPEMGRIWSEENSFQKWLDVEILAAEGLARMGRVPQAAISRIRRKARLNVKRIRAIEAEVKHETIAFLSAIAETIGDDARYLHVGMTSSDVMDTALAIQFKEASTILEQDIKDLMSVLRRQARKYKWTVMIGRTHGVHAEPITFGLKLAICTASTPENMALAFDRFGLDRHMDTVVSPADGVRGKPHPDIFLEAARRLGVPPEQCIVFEDAPLGIEAARRARMMAVALTTSLPREEFVACDNILGIVSDLTEVDVDALLRDAKNKETPDA